MKKPTPDTAEVDDLSVLLSTRAITIAGKALTVREFTLMDSLVLHGALAPVIASLADIMQAERPSFEAVQQVLVEHAQVLPLLMAHCVDQPVDWVSTLPGGDGLALMDWWWTMNRRFFMTAAVRQMTLRAALTNVPSDSAASSPPSSGPVTAQTSSVATPPDS